VILEWVCACDAPLACDAVSPAPDVVVLGALDGRVHGVRLADGSRLWETQLPRLHIVSLHVLPDGAILAGVSVRARGCGALVVLSPSDGTVQWTWNASGALKGAIAAAGTRLVGAAIRQRGGEVACVERGARRALWRTAFDAWVYGVLVHDDMVFAPCSDERMHCLDLATGERRWTFATHGLVCALPLIHDATVYFGAHDAVFYALDMEGRLRWRSELADRMSGAAAAVAGLIVLGGWDARVRALDARSGEQRWAYDAGAPIVAAPLAIDRTVFIGTDGGQLLAIDADGGNLIDCFPSGDPLGCEIKTRPLSTPRGLVVAAHDGAAYLVKPGPAFARLRK
jgi:outer membrane protein assembly factor BamB